MKPIWLLLIVACIFSMKVQAQSFEPEEHATFQTNRTDGRFVSSRAVAHHLMKELEPASGLRCRLPTSKPGRKMFACRWNN